MSQFVKQIFSSCLGTLFGLTLFATLGIGGLISLLVAISSQDNTPQVAEKTMLVVDLSQTIADAPQPLRLAEVLRNRPTTLSLRQVLEALEKARTDQRIVGVLLYGKSTVGANGYATLTEVRRALEKLRTSGKKILAYDVDWSEREYYLASLADMVSINPMGVVELNGLSSQPLFFTGALEKYGIGVQVVRVGNYKSAVEPFVRENLSPENRQQTQAILNDLWNGYLQTIAPNRKQTPSNLQALADTQGILTPPQAQKAGLVDKIAYFDEVISEVRKLTGEKTPAKADRPSFRQISLENYSSIVNRSSTSTEPTIAVLYAQGEIVDGVGERGQVGGDRFAREVRKLRENKDIKAVVLRVNSPGGSATASDIIYRELYLLNQTKPLIISMGDVAASGGYWLATAGREIFAQNNTITGSIGVFGLLFNVEELARNNGLKWDTVKTGKLANLGTNTRPQSEAELKIYQASVNQVYTLFIERVAKARKLPVAKVKEIAQGRVWSGSRAKAIGLVDEIGGLEMAMKRAAEIAKIGDKWQVKEYPEPTTFESELFSRFLETQVLSAKNDPLTSQWLKWQKELGQLTNFNDPRGIYSRLPLHLDVR
jgi:protease-4